MVSTLDICASCNRSEPLSPYDETTVFAREGAVYEKSRKCEQTEIDVRLPLRVIARINSRPDSSVIIYDAIGNNVAAFASHKGALKITGWLLMFAHQRRQQETND